MFLVVHSLDAVINAEREIQQLHRESIQYSLN